MSDNHDLDAPIDPLDEQLTAYLDGELNAPEARELEMRLARDEEARHRLRELAGAWDMLDTLPRTRLDQRFARTTVALVVQEAAKDIAQFQEQAPSLIRKRWIGGLAGVAAALAIGFFALNYFLPDPNRRLLDDYTLIENWQLYKQAGSIDFLAKLKEQKLFTQESVDDSSGNMEFVAFDKNSLEIQNEIKGLPENQRSDLRRRYEELQKLPAAEVDQLRDFERELRKRPDFDQLYHVMQGYYDWLSLRSPIESADLLRLNTDDRVKRTRELFSKSYGAPTLEPQDIRAVFQWMKDLTWTHRDEILRDEATESDKAWYNEFKTEKDQKFAIVRIHANYNFRNRSFGKPPAFLSKITETEYMQLIDKLSEGTRKQIAPYAITADMPANKKKENIQEGLKIIGKWIGPATHYGMNPRWAPTQEEFQEFIKQVPQERKDELLKLYPAPKDFEHALREEYAKSWDQRGFGPGRSNNGGKGGGYGRRRPGDGPPGEFNSGPGQGGQPGDRRGRRDFGPPGDRGPGDHGPGDHGPGENRGPGDGGPGPNGEFGPQGKGRPGRDGQFGDGQFGKDGPPPPRDDRPPPRPEDEPPPFDDPPPPK